MFLFIVLLVVIIAFSLGNLLLFFVPSVSDKLNDPKFMNLLKNYNRNNFVDTDVSSFSSELVAPSSDFVVDDSLTLTNLKNNHNAKINMLSTRINSLEHSINHLSKTLDSTYFSSSNSIGPALISNSENNSGSSETFNFSAANNFSLEKNNLDSELNEIKSLLKELAQNKSFLNSLENKELEKKIRALGFNS